MSHSRKDGKRKGGHQQAKRTGKEYWSRRPGTRMATPGRAAKVKTHRAERRIGRKHADLARVSSNGRTEVFGPSYPGSNPGTLTTEEKLMELEKLVDAFLEEAAIQGTDARRLGSFLVLEAARRPLRGPVVPVEPVPAVAEQPLTVIEEPEEEDGKKPAKRRR